MTTFDLHAGKALSAVGTDKRPLVGVGAAVARQVLRATKHGAAVGALHGGGRGCTRERLRHYHLTDCDSVLCHGSVA